MEYKPYLPECLRLAAQAGERILQFYGDKQVRVVLKSDQSYVTEADWAAEAILMTGLHSLNPEITVISEESPLPSLEIRKALEYYWLIDPLDGTQEFLGQTDEFTVNISLMRGMRPILGVIYAPVLDLFYFASATGGAYQQHGMMGVPERIETRSYSGQPGSVLQVVVSRRAQHSDMLQRLLVPFSKCSTVELIVCGSALKFGWIAQGRADLYLRLGPTGAWDTAAGHCIVQEAGGGVFDFTGLALQYPVGDVNASLLNPDFFAVGARDYPWREMLCQGLDPQ
jgi:3'(2'), 5'-bisphosphate nucleotidase